MDRQDKKSIIGRDADAGRNRQGTDGADLANQLNGTTDESAGAAVSGTAEDRRNLDIVFEREEPEQ